MDDLSSCKYLRLAEQIKCAVASVRQVPLYSSISNPIEKAFLQLKAFLRKAAERTLEARGRLSANSSTEAMNYFIS